MHIIVIDIEPLLGIGAATVSESGVEDRSVGWRLFGFGDHHYDFGAAPLK